MNTAGLAVVSFGGVEMRRANDGRVTVDSRVVAARFRKEHFHVLRDIRELECSEEFRASNFGASSYLSEGKSLPCFLMTRDGFAMLAMGFTGREAVQWKEMFLAAFNELEAQARQGGGLGTAFVVRRIDERFDELTGHMTCEADRVRRDVNEHTDRKIDEAQQHVTEEAGHVCAVQQPQLAEVRELVVRQGFVLSALLAHMPRHTYRDAYVSDGKGKLLLPKFWNDAEDYKRQLYELNHVKP